MIYQERKQFVEPEYTASLVEVWIAIVKRATRPVSWSHSPVPEYRVDAAYFAPLREPELGGTELYPGLLHPDDEQRTKKRINAAVQFVETIGVATESGLGRFSPTELPASLRISKRVRGPRVRKPDWF